MDSLSHALSFFNRILHGGRKNASLRFHQFKSGVVKPNPLTLFHQPPPIATLISIYYPSFPAMASTVDSTSSPRSAQAVPKFVSPLSHHVRGEHEQCGGWGDNATGFSSPITPVVLPARSPRKQSVETQSPRSSAGSEHGGSGNASDVSTISRGKRPAWKVPSNSAIEAGSVIDAISWPALTDSARASPKSFSSDSLKALPDGSLSAPSGSLESAPSLKKSSNTQNLNSTQNSLSPRDKSTKRGNSNNNTSEASNFGQAMPSSSPVLTESCQSEQSKLPSLENSPRGLANQSGGNNDNDRDHKSGRSFQPHPVNGHQRGYGGGRRGSNGNHNSYGNRRDGERGGYEWNHRNFGRDVHMQQLHQQRGVRPYLRPSAAAASPFISPPPLRPFSNHIGFPDFPSPIYYVTAPSHSESLRGVPFAPHPAHAPQVMIFPAADPQRAMLLKQIDYYFSPANLCKDIFLRQNMDEQGWVPISVIADFNRVKQMTNSIQYLLDTVQLSSVVEVQGDKIRKRNDWMAWLLHQYEDFPSSGIPSSTTNFDGLEAHFDNVYLDLDAPNNTGFNGVSKNELTFSRSASMNLNSQQSLRNSVDDDGQVGNYSDHVWNTRTLVRNDTM